jgi:hypothetical protein
MTNALSMKRDSATIVASENFILATRDTGYRSVVGAVAELIDNSLQAKAQHVRVDVRDETIDGERTVTLAVLDDGDGMSAATLRRALQFGGSDRFDARSGLGRFGMGLPNSSVSQTRRFDVYSWQRNGPVLTSYLDVDEVAAGQQQSIPEPVETTLPRCLGEYAGSHGTLVVWTRCDRLARLRAATIANRLRESLGRLYRFALWDGVRITVNDSPTSPVDPLFVSSRSALSGGVLYGSPLKYEFTALGGGTAMIEVRFAELPVHAWHAWPTGEKRRSGIVGRAGVSIVRAGREIDYGWYLMGGKRRENYDDWWRCEVCFTPELDEMFGVTHSKQGITPAPELRAALEPDLEAIARVLNGRVRAAFEDAKVHTHSRASQAASDRDQFLPLPLPAKHTLSGTGLSYRIEIRALGVPEFYQVALSQNTVILTLNGEHPFYDRIYGPLTGRQSRERDNIELMLLAAARADLEAADSGQADFLLQVRRSWSDALVAFLER